jgi:hypothetical protein
MRGFTRLFHLLATVALLAATAGGALAAAGVPAEVETAIRRVSDYYGRLHTVQVKVQTVVRLEPAGEQKPIQSLYDVTLRKPNRASMRLTSSYPSPTYVCDGKTLYAYRADTNQYTSKEAPADMDGIFQHSQLNSLSLGCLLAKTFLNKDPRQNLLKGVRQGRLEGTETLDGVSCARVKLSREGSDVELWIPKEDPPLVRKVVTISTRGGAIQRGNPQVIQAQVIVTFTDWKIDPELTGDPFVFTPPVGAKRVEVLNPAAVPKEVGGSERK